MFIITSLRAVLPCGPVQCCSDGQQGVQVSALVTVHMWVLTSGDVGVCVSGTRLARTDGFSRSCDSNLCLAECE